MTSVAVRKHRGPIRVLLADDHPVVREGLRAALLDYPHIDIVGEASNGEEAVRMAEQLAPDVVLMDITMPRMTGLRATSELSCKAPDTKVLVLTMHDSREYVVQLLRSGAKGYVLKDASPTELRHAIEIVASGAPFFSPSISQVLVTEYLREARAPRRPTPRLSLREREVLGHIADGASSKQIAGFLGISVRTVETHRARIIKKLGIRSVAGLTKFAIAEGLVRSPTDNLPNIRD